RVRETPSSPTRPKATMPEGRVLDASVGRVESSGPAATPPVAVIGAPTIGLGSATVLSSLARQRARKKGHTLRVTLLVVSNLCPVRGRPIAALRENIGNRHRLHSHMRFDFELVPVHV